MSSNDIEIEMALCCQVTYGYMYLKLLSGAAQPGHVWFEAADRLDFGILVVRYMFLVVKSCLNLDTPHLTLSIKL